MNRFAQCLPSVDHAFAIAGRRWQEDLNMLGDKVTRLDNFVVGKMQIKKEFNPVGSRKILYIGCTLPVKNTALLSDIGQVHPGVISHMGYGSIPNTKTLGFIRSDTPMGQKIVSQYDFVITPGLTDANPTTTLEAMSWGIIPISTDGCGYDDDSILKISSNKYDAVCQIKEILALDAETLVLLQKKNLETVKVYDEKNFFSHIEKELKKCGIC
jgi:hypothetical protein